MRMWGQCSVLSAAEEEAIHQAALDILSKVGVVVESESLLNRLEEQGGQVERSQMRVTFTPSRVERFLNESDRFDWEAITPLVEGRAHIYYGYYLNPENDQFEPWRTETVLQCLKHAYYLERVSGRISYAFPVDNIPNEALLPFFNYLSLKFCGFSIASVNSVEWAPLVLRMCEMAAEEWGLPLDRILRPHVHMITPLKLAREEARQLELFADRHLPIGVGHMESAGGSAPVTLAGAMALDLAQGLFINILRRACFGERKLSLGCYISPLDMRTGMYACGRPEKEICNVALAQMARRYGASFRGHTGHADAKRPSVEAGFQRALNSIPTLMACGHTTISCGLLSVDEVMSPLQMIIDDEIISALQRFAQGCEVSAETLALEVISTVGPGGSFLETDHTLRHFRTELWEPRLFTREGFGGWQLSGMKNDVDKAWDIYRDIVKRDPPPIHVSPILERKLLELIRETCGAQIRPVEPV